MSDKRISQLVERVTIANNDVLPIVALNAATTNKVTISTIQDWMQTHMDLGVTSISVNTSTSGSDITISGSPITSTGTITINIPTASATNRGALSSTDWSTFNGKQDVLTFYSPLQKNGVSVTIDQADTDTSGYLSFTDWNTFNNKEGALTKGNLTETISGVLTITGGTAAVIGTGTTIEVKQASGSQDGFLDSADWTTFNNKVSTSRSISTTAPLQGGGDLSANRTLSITQSGSASNGYLSSTDWNTFNNKQDYLSGTGVVKSTAGTISYINGLATQYIDGTGSLQTFPSIIGTANNLTREVYNETGTTLVKGTVVYINGGHGNLPTIAKALATGDGTSAQTYGVVQTDISDQSNGYIVVIGDLFDMPTNGYLVGTQLYLSSTTAGEFTSTKQYAPAHLVYVGIVTRSHPTQGVIAIKIQNGYEMDELHDVYARNPDNNDILQFKTATNLWTKVAGSTTNIAEGTNLYYTDARSRAAFSESVTGLDYNSSTGVLSTTAGYGIPTTASQSNWDAAYNDKINSAAVTGTTTKTLTLTQQDGGTITASWTDINTDAVSSVFGRTGAVVAVSGDYNTDLVTEGTTNKYFTNGRARTAISLTTTGSSGSATYSDVTGVFNIPTYTLSGLGGEPTIAAGTTAQYWRGDKSWQTLNTSAVAESGTNLYFTDGRARAAISLTTTGTSGAATYSGGVLNIPQYQSVLTNPITGTGTTNKVAKFSGATTIADSSISDPAGAVLSIIKDASAITSALVSISPTTGTNASILNLDNAGAGSFFVGRQNSAGASVLLGSLSAYDAVMGNTGGQSLHLVTTAASRLVVFGNGNIAINNTTDQGYKLDVVGTGRFTNNLNINTSANEVTALTITAPNTLTAPAFSIRQTNSSIQGYDFDTENNTFGRLDLYGVTSTGRVLMTTWMKSTGNFLIGTTTDAGYKLNVNGSLRSIGNSYLSTTTTGVVAIGTTSNVSSGTSNILQIGDRGIIQNVVGNQMMISNNAYYDGGWKYITTLNTQAIRFGAQLAGDISFHVAPSGTAGTSISGWDDSCIKMYISPTGNIGVGTKSPEAIFTITKTNGNYTSSSAGHIVLNNLDATGQTAIYYTYNGTMKGKLRSDYVGNMNYTANGGDHNFFIGGDAGTGSVKLLVSSAGTLVNTTTGVSGGGALQVNGDVNINGNFKINGTIIGGGGGSGVTGSGTANYITKWSGASTLSNSIIRDDGSTITVIGGVEIAARFAAAGDSTIIIGGTAAQGVSSGEQYITYQNGTTNTNAWMVGMDDGEDWRFAYGAQGEITDANTLMRMSQTGALGLGTLTPSEKFHVQDGNVSIRIQSTTAGQNANLKIVTTARSWSIGPNQYLGDSSFEFVDATAGASRMTIFTSGNLSINNGSSPTDNGYKLQVGGSIYATADVIAYSDISVKKNIRNIENALERVTKSRGVIYDRKDIDSKDNIGFIAQELEEQFPELISKNADGTKGVKYQNAVAVLFEAIKEQQKQINELKNRN